MAFQRSTSLDFSKGHNLKLSSIETTLHVGAHADGPNHYSKDGVGIDARELEPYLGPCLVIEARVPRGERIKRQHLVRDPESFKEWPVSRILVRTGSFPNPENWNSDFASFSPELIREWAGLGVRLIGIDTPSIDPENSKDLPSHQAVAQANMFVLEGLVLDGVQAGPYSLIALPLKIEGADAAPVRAVLVDHRYFAE